MQAIDFQFNPFQERGVLLWDRTGRAAIVDPGFYDEDEAGRLFGEISSRNLTPECILLTHGHFDHIYGVAQCVSRYHVPVYMSDADKQMVEVSAEFAEHFSMKAPDTGFETVNVNDRDTVKFGETTLKVLTSPGHTPGSVCYFAEHDRILFSGDTLFAGSIGRTDMPGGDYDKLIVSLMEKIMILDSDVQVVPGHGPVTNIGHERTHNPFLQPFNEPDQDTLDWDAGGIELHPNG